MKSKNYSENIIKVFKKDGFVLSEPDDLLDSDYIIQRSGENFRKLMFTFEDDTGKSMCLRPDLTVASCIKYLKGNSQANSKIFYSGQAYRRSNSPKDKVINDQLGIEILGSKNKSTDDLKVLKTITNSIKKIKIKNTSIKVSDVSLFQKLIESLTIPERWKIRLKRHFWRPQYFEDLLNRLETNSDVDPAAVELDKKKFSDMKSLNQSKEIANRKVSEILSRFDRKIKDPRYKHFGKRLIYQNQPEVLSKDEYKEIQQDIAKKILSIEETNFTTIPMAESLIDNMRNEKGITKEKLDYINDIDAYISDIRKVYEKAL